MLVPDLKVALWRCEGAEAQDWDSKVQDAKDAVNFQANAMATAYGKELNVSADDVLWGMGQVNFHAMML